MRLRTTSGLSRSVAGWARQVTVSLGATLSATLIWSAVPHPSAAPAPPPELTTGGKFAARALHEIAYDGLDAMPLPHVAPARFAVAPAFAAERPASAADRTAPAATPHRALWDDAATASPARAARQARGPARAEARRVEPVPHGPVAVVAPAEAPAPAPEGKADDGLLGHFTPSALPDVLPALASTARSAWTVTAEAGGALMARVIPQIP